MTGFGSDDYFRAGGAGTPAEAHPASSGTFAGGDASGSLGTKNGANTGDTNARNSDKPSRSDSRSGKHRKEKERKRTSDASSDVAFGGFGGFADAPQARSNSRGEEKRRGKSRSRRSGESRDGVSSEAAMDSPGMGPATAANGSQGFGGCFGAHPGSGGAVLPAPCPPPATPSSLGGGSASGHLGAGAGFFSDAPTREPSGASVGPTREPSGASVGSRSRRRRTGQDVPPSAEQLLNGALGMPPSSNPGPGGDMRWAFSSQGCRGQAAPPSPAVSAAQAPPTPAVEPARLGGPPTGPLATPQSQPRQISAQQFPPASSSFAAAPPQSSPSPLVNPALGLGAPRHPVKDDLRWAFPPDSAIPNSSAFGSNASRATPAPAGPPAARAPCPHSVEAAVLAAFARGPASAAIDVTWALPPGVKMPPPGQPLRPQASALDRFFSNPGHSNGMSCAARDLASRTGMEQEFGSNAGSQRGDGNRSELLEKLVMSMADELRELKDRLKVQPAPAPVPEAPAPTSMSTPNDFGRDKLRAAASNANGIRLSDSDDNATTADMMTDGWQSEHSPGGASRSSARSPAMPSSRSRKASSRANGVALSWAVDEARMAEYRSIFLQLDRDRKGLVDGTSVRPVMDRTRLPASELSEIWVLTDTDQDGWLSFGEFVCALELARQCEAQGIAVPTELPPALAINLSLPPPTAAHGGVAASSPAAPRQPSDQDLIIEEVPGGSFWATSAGFGPGDPNPQATMWNGASGPAGVADDRAGAGATSIEPAEFASYESTFREFTASYSSSSVGPDEGRVFFESSGLPVPELAHIWRISDADGDGRLALGEFVLAMVLVAARRRGATLPTEAPPKLVASIAALAAGRAGSAAAADEPGTPGAATPAPGAAGSAWALSAQEVQRLTNLFHKQADPEGTGFAVQANAKTLLEQSGLPPEDLVHIWLISDLDGDGQLSLAEFVCAGAIASRRSKGAPLPEAPPNELLASLPPPPPPGAPPEFAQTVVSSPQSWAPNETELAAYRAVLEGLGVATAGASVGPEAGRTLLERSGLPQSELAHIWRLSDIDGDGRLASGEFACAMAMVAGRRSKGFQLPPSLPRELAQLASQGLPPAGTSAAPHAEHAPAASPQPTAASATSPAVQDAQLSPWTVSPEELVKYKDLFHSMDTSGSGVIGPDDARRVLESSRLPTQELMEIWELADASGTGDLTMGEFVCAMALAWRRRQGLQLPQALPPELAQHLERRGPGGAPCRQSAAQPNVEMDMFLTNGGGHPVGAF